ncbi:MAG TPA: hypothetical protein VN541_12575 [Tepidisphaeraceae bacterium]|nr:hypothetical protein [Tepidisphaeraceae bacterium]
MWGNAQGWAISAVMVLATVAWMFKVSVPQGESQPQGLIPGAYQAIALPMDPKLIMPPGNKECDAGQLYRQALIQFQANPRPYNDPIHASAFDLPAVQLMVDATDCGRAEIFGAHLQQLINYNNEQPEIDAFIKMADAASIVGMGHAVDNNPDQAMPYFRAVFALGRRLFNERITWREMSAGLSIMSEATVGMAKLADQKHDAARADQLRRFQRETDAYRTKLQQTVASPLSNPVESYDSKYAGDVFAIAKDSDAAQVWRVQAILHLGRYRWNVADDHRADQEWAVRELAMLKGSLDARNSDPAIVTAINAAQSLTLEQQRLTNTSAQ